MTESKSWIGVLAGTNGAGKSSVLGAFLRHHGGEYHNPDETARRLLALNPGMSAERANGLAWSQGYDRLNDVVAHGGNFYFETTLGGNTIPRTLAAAIENGCRVTVWYVGLSSLEQHIERVAARVKRGGHDIPREKIRERFDRSRENLVHLLPGLHELVVFDNSIQVDTAAGEGARPSRLLALRQGKIVEMARPETVPAWAKPILAAALKQNVPARLVN